MLGQFLNANRPLFFALQNNGHTEFFAQKWALPLTAQGL